MRLDCSHSPCAHRAAPGSIRATVARLILLMVACLLGGCLEPIRIVALLGDSTVATTYLPPGQRPEARLEAEWTTDAVAVLNAARNGESVLRLLEEHYDSVPEADIYVLRFGQNDRKRYNPERFGELLAQLCDRLEADYPGAQIVLETGLYFDPDLHPYGDQSENIHAPYWAVTRALAAERGYPLSDVHAAMEARAGEAFLWDSGHPNAAGVELAVGVLRPVLEPIVAALNAPPE